ncbi:hypothetical protein D9M71_208770 [compost metagenome]
MHAEDRHAHGEDQHHRGRPHQQADHQRQAAEELGAAGQGRHQVARRHAEGFQPLAHALQARAAERAEQLLRAVGHEGQAGGNTQNCQADAGVGGKNRFDQ